MTGLAKRLEIWPAIDLLQGQAVRLTKGDYQKVKVYFRDPEEIFSYFVSKGARHLHMVDLDGAREGYSVNFDTTKKIAALNRQYAEKNGTKALELEVGGGIRSRERIEDYLAIGIDHVILGTGAVKDPDFTRSMIAEYGPAVVIGVDALNGKVAVQGWMDVTSLSGLDFCRKLQKEGVKRVIYTDISKDGMLAGTNLDLYRELTRELSMEITASGGISSMDDISRLKEMGVRSAIIGKAIYEGRIDLEKAIEIGDKDAG